MKKALLFILIIGHCLLSHGQGGVWTWMNGDTLIQSHGHYGSKGVADPANYPPARYQAVQWTDLNGNFWIFGGLSQGGMFDDLWKFDPRSNIWTWMRGDSSTYLPVYGTMGIPAPNNTPGSRSYGVASWTDLQGHLWMHGGYGYDVSGSPSLNGLDDMWMYDIPTNQWTWMKGPDTASWQGSYGTLQIEDPANTPGSRNECNSAWVKSDGTLWTFGGQNVTGNYSDMWMFDVGTNNWTWMSGYSSHFLYSFYGTENVESSWNVPWPRWSYSNCKDVNDNFYMFSGAAGVGDFYNDMWKYNSSDNYWTWEGGDSTDSYLQDTIYTQYCLPGNILPTARAEFRTSPLNDCSNSFWFFGGYTRHTLINELWNYDIDNHHWTFVSGDSTNGFSGRFGTKGVPSASNMPPARGGHCMWTDHSGTIWIFGGNYQSELGDMWKFQPDLTCLPPSINSHITAVQRNICLGDSLLFNRHYISTSGVYQDTTASASGCDSITKLTIIVDSLGTPTISKTGNILNASPAAHYQWQLNGVNIIGDTMANITITRNGTYTVIESTAAGCSSSASINIKDNGIVDVSDAITINIHPNPATQTCTISVSNYGGEHFTARLIDIAGQEVSGPMSFSSGSFTFPVSSYAKGGYVLQVAANNGAQAVRKLVVE